MRTKAYLVFLPTSWLSSWLVKIDLTNSSLWLTSTLIVEEMVSKLVDPEKSALSTW